MVGSGVSVDQRGSYTDRANPTVCNQPAHVTCSLRRTYIASRLLHAHTVPTSERPVSRQMQENAEILAVIAEDAPNFDDDAVKRIVEQRYGLGVTVRSLLSERDQNLALLTADGQQYVLKIANSAQDPAVADFQTRALQHVALYADEHETPIATPRILPTLAGEAQTTVEAQGREHIVRIVSFLPGVPIANRIPSATLSYDLGVYLAHLGRALAEFEHAGSQQILLWDLQQAANLRRLSEHLPNAAVRRDVDHALDDFEEFALPGFDSLRRQFIHSDFNPDNVLTESAQSDSISGVIDFGDLLEAPLIVDLAIGASYLRPLKGDPLALITEMFAGYHCVTPLIPDEVDMLFDLVKVRLCTSISILSWRASLHGADDPYLEKSRCAEPGAETFLSSLTQIPRRDVVGRFRRAIAG